MNKDIKISGWFRAHFSSRKTGRFVDHGFIDFLWVDLGDGLAQSSYAYRRASPEQQTCESIEIFPH